MTGLRRRAWGGADFPVATASMLLMVLSGAGAVTSRAAAAAPAWCTQVPDPQLKTLTVIDVMDSWFVVYRIREGVFAITEPRQAEQVISYLIIGTRRAVLFDTGLGIGNISRVVHRLTRLPIIVLNSHTHFDHVGGNAEFKDVRSQDIAFSRRSARGEMSASLADYARRTLDVDHICGMLPAKNRARPFTMHPWHITHYVRDLEVFDIGGRELTVIFTPGHTPDSMCLLDRRNGLLFTGDTFYPGSIYLWAPGADLNAYARSVDLLARLVPDLKMLLPAHGRPTADPDDLLRLKDAVTQLRTGSLVPLRTKEGRLLYRFGNFAFLLAAP